MVERMFDGDEGPGVRVFEPPRPVWVRVLDRSKRAWPTAGLQWAWVPVREWGGWSWAARVSTVGAPERTWLVAPGSVLLRSPEDLAD